MPHAVFDEKRQRGNCCELCTHGKDSNYMYELILVYA